MGSPVPKALHMNFWWEFEQFSVGQPRPHVSLRYGISAPCLRTRMYKFSWVTSRFRQHKMTHWPQKDIATITFCNSPQFPRCNMYFYLCSLPLFLSTWFKFTLQSQFLNQFLFLLSWINFASGLKKNCVVHCPIARHQCPFQNQQLYLFTYFCSLKSYIIACFESFLQNCDSKNCLTCGFGWQIRAPYLLPPCLEPQDSWPGVQAWSVRPAMWKCLRPQRSQQLDSGKLKQQKPSPSPLGQGPISALHPAHSWDETGTLSQIFKHQS